MYYISPFPLYSLEQPKSENNKETHEERFTGGRKSCNKEINSISNRSNAALTNETFQGGLNGLQQEKIFI